VTTNRQIDSLAVCDSLRQSNHSECVACGDANRLGLALEFEVPRPGYVEAVFDCPNSLQSYDGILHGGIICLLLDAAMTNCGFSMGRTMVTGDLQVRFLHPVPTGKSVLVRAWADDRSDVLQIVRAEVRLNETVMARATGKFVDLSSANEFSSDTA
jgi:acyl-coenzyme A thioesterase PaaI-like protein